MRISQTFSHLFPESGELSRNITSCCNMQECTFRVGCIFYGECSIMAQNEKAFWGFLECASNCQIQIYKVLNLSNFSPHLCLIPSICLPLSFAFLCKSLFFLACSVFDFFFSFCSKCSGWKNKDVRILPRSCSTSLCICVGVCVHIGTSLNQQSC